MKTRKDLTPIAKVLSVYAIKESLLNSELAPMIGLSEGVLGKTMRGGAYTFATADKVIAFLEEEVGRNPIQAEEFRAGATGRIGGPGRGRGRLHKFHAKPGTNKALFFDTVGGMQDKLETVAMELEEDIFGLLHDTCISWMRNYLEEDAEEVNPDPEAEGPFIEPRGRRDEMPTDHTPTSATFPDGISIQPEDDSPPLEQPVTPERSTDL